jgi:SAM-dependent methyltransferase
MTAQPSTEEILARIRERIAARGGGVQVRRQKQSAPAAAADQTASDGVDLSELRRQVSDAYTEHAAVGQLNPRNPGLLNDLAQFIKKVMRRSLSWYTRPIQLFQGAVLRSLDQIVIALGKQQELVTRLIHDSRTEGEKREQLEGSLERKLRTELHVRDAKYVEQHKLLRTEIRERDAEHEHQHDSLRTDISAELSRVRSATEQEMSQLRDTTRSALAEVRETLSSLETHSKELSRVADIHLGSKARAELWFNPPIVVQYSEDDRAFWSGTTERIVEKAWLMRQLATLNAGSTILDVGANESTLALELASNGYKVTALDFRRYPLVHPNLQVVQGDICDSGLESDSFDAVILLSTIEHIGLGTYGDPKSSTLSIAMGEVYRLLRPAGTLLLTVPFGVSAVTPIHRIFDSADLRELVSQFQVKQLQFGRRVDVKTWISPVPEETVNTLPDSSENGPPQAVAMAVCSKQPE